jgi:hypothetical protein
MIVQQASDVCRTNRFHSITGGMTGFVVANFAALSAFLSSRRLAMADCSTDA